MKKKTLIIVAILIVIALFAGLTVPMLLKEKTKTGTENDPAAVSSKETDSPAQESKEPAAKTETSAGETKKEKESVKTEGTDETDKTEEGDSSGSGSSSGGSAGSQESPSDSSGNSGSKDSQQAPQGQSSGEIAPDIPTISFPYTISESDLVIEQISSYDGYFIEDASDSDVSGIAAIVLSNNGSDDLEFAGIGISQGTRSLGFSASQIPAGATVIVLEQNKASFSSDPYYSATATTTPAGKFEMSEELVTVKDNGDNSLIVTNISDKTLSDIKVFFKNYLADEDIYVGGITYTITLKEDLEAGASIGVSASHYDSKFSKVLEVQAKQ